MFKCWSKGLPSHLFVQELGGAVLKKSGSNVKAGRNSRTRGKVYCKEASVGVGA